MTKLITCGKYNNQYKFIWFLVISRLIFSYFFTYNTFAERYKPTFLKIEFPSSIFIKEFSEYIILFIGSFIFYQIEINQRAKISETSPSSLKGKKDTKLNLIYNKNRNIFRLPWTFYVSILLFVLSSMLIDHYYHISLQGLDFWELELIFISFINMMIFKTQVYRHQKLAIYLIIISCSIIKYIDIINIIKDDSEKKIYKEFIYLIPIALIGFILFIFLQSYAYCQAKYYFDYKYISVNKYLMWTGIIGGIITFIGGFIAGFKECVPYSQYKYIKYICKIYDTDYNHKFYDSFKIFFKQLWKKKSTLISIEYIFLFILKNFNSFLTTYFTFLIIKNLSPEYFICANSIYYFITSIFSVIDSILSKKGVKQNTALSELLSITGTAIYLEFIELNFCELNHDLKDLIRKRSVSEITELSSFAEEIEDED